MAPPPPPYVPSPFSGPGKQKGIFLRIVSKLFGSGSPEEDPFPAPSPAYSATSGTSSVISDEIRKRIEEALAAEKDDATLMLINDVKSADVSDTKEVAARFLALTYRYHHNVLGQAGASFRWALVAAGIGLFFLVAAMSIFLLEHWANIAMVSFISGALVEVISAINFVLYARASRQFASFHFYLDRTHRYLIANSVCSNIADQKSRDKARSELVREIMKTSELTMEDTSLLYKRQKSKQIKISST
jgi:hypothetical protein